MNGEAGFLQAIQEQPEDAGLRLIFADWLEGQGDERGELLRLLHTLTEAADVAERQQKEERLRQLLTAGVQAPLPRVTNSLGMTLALIPPGTFRMGSPKSEQERQYDEGPQRVVTLTRPFYLGIYPVTQQEYKTIMGENPSRHRGGSRPVENVSWRLAATFCLQLSLLPAEKAARRVYRLPTEAEWEYACRAGTSTPFWWGGSASSEQANFDGSHPYGDAEPGANLQRTTKVGSYAANAFGLYDVHGNVWEWCQDWYKRSYGRKRTAHNPRGPEHGEERVLRGGSWGVIRGLFCRSACRGQETPDAIRNDYGFRVALTVS